MIRLEIDGKVVETEEGATILQVALQNGIDIPYFCYNKDLEPYGGCRICLVEVTEGHTTRLQPSCAYPAKDGLIVRTDTEAIRRGRRLIAELLLARCPTIKAVQNLARQFGVKKSRFREVHKDCVLCGQCVRICRDLVKASAIDFIGRGFHRYPGTPFDMPSEDCVGCGSCTYVCPTGFMKMEYENVLRWRQLPGPMRKCRYMRMGFISHKICPNNYACWNCEVDQIMEDEAKTHPVFILKEARAKETDIINGFQLLFDRMYSEEHVWAKRLNGFFRMGIDDFARKIIGKAGDIKVPPLNTKLDRNDPVWLITVGEKALHMYSPVPGKVVDLNPDVIDHPELTTADPYGRGWILAIEPDDLLQASKELLAGRSAVEWLKLESTQLYQTLSKAGQELISVEKGIPEDFALTSDRRLWGKIDRHFFAPKRKKVRLKEAADIATG